MATAEDADVGPRIKPEDDGGWVDRYPSMRVLRKRALFTPISAETAAGDQPFAGHHQTFKNRPLSVDTYLRVVHFDAVGHKEG
ncbi:hypothetical protein ABID08_000314 [Rhizobium binae]|uniref:Uncharacterized protein n=1 Tax=Rhizobium binae TaxID=1138190 RepID=A0ABV2M924_9HYPH|nr:hypothetical protein [Rhizobium binae]MBX4952682.1 hypothetical protein [Rhizobium binae]MBX4991913.1 hypothetical protein [Rhizobium binae]QSY81094.1 hypothetical protein J2J99_15525 [Rhizobium binae]